jgi:hypothetical protein
MAMRRLSRNRALAALAAFGAVVALAPDARAQQAIYSNFNTPAIDTRNNSTAWLGTGSSFVQNESATDTTTPLVSQMMLDDLFPTLPGAGVGSLTINSIAFKVANGAVDGNGTPVAMNNVRVYLTVYEDDGFNPNGNNNGPGTQYGRYDLGLVNLAAPTANPNRTIASITDINVSSSTLQNLTLPITNQAGDRYWFGLFFVQERNLALTNDQQKLLLGQVGVAFYDDVRPSGEGSNLPTGIGDSGDVHYETAQDTGTIPLQRNRFNGGFGNGPTGREDRFAAIFPSQPQVNSNFAWLINGTYNFTIPEPGAGPLLFLGAPVAAAFFRKRRAKK